MRVITVHSTVARGSGIDSTIATTLSTIHQLRPEIKLEVICNETGGFEEDGFLRDIPVTEVKRRKFRGYSHFSFFPELVGLDVTDDSIVHVHHPTAVLPLFLKKGKKVFTYHGNNRGCWNHYDFGPFLQRVLRRGIMDTSTLLCRSFDKIVAISDFLRNELIEAYGFPPQRIERIDWGVDTSLFRPASADEGYMLFVGRHVGYKSIRTLIDLAAEVQFPLVLVGDGKERNALEQYAKSRDAPVTFKGRVPLSELVDLYQRCSFYVTASLWEGFGLPPLEAAACGKPAIVPDNTAHPEITLDKRTGLVYKDTCELRMVARSLISSLDQRTDLGSAARARAERNFDVRQTAQAYVDLYSSLTPC